MNENVKNGVVELDDDMLDGVAGGLVQVGNPDTYSYDCFADGTVCQHCGCSYGDYKKLLKRMKCGVCREKMVNRKVYANEVIHVEGSGSF